MKHKINIFLLVLMALGLFCSHTPKKNEVNAITPIYKEWGELIIYFSDSIIPARFSSNTKNIDDFQFTIINNEEHIFSGQIIIGSEIKLPIPVGENKLKYFITTGDDSLNASMLYQISTKVRYKKPFKYLSMKERCKEITLNIKKDESIKLRPSIVSEKKFTDIYKDYLLPISLPTYFYEVELEILSSNVDLANHKRLNNNLNTGNIEDYGYTKLIFSENVIPEEIRLSNTYTNSARLIFVNLLINNNKFGINGIIPMNAELKFPIMAGDAKIKYKLHRSYNINDQLKTIGTSTEESNYYKTISILVKKNKLTTLNLTRIGESNFSTGCIPVAVFLPIPIPYTTKYQEIGFKIDTEN